jgi:AcrR family transcriptional regulator
MDGTDKVNASEQSGTRTGATAGAAPRLSKREQREQSMERLLAAARTLFVSRGYLSTTLEQIAAAAGLTKGAVYFHFGSKEAVLVHLLQGIEDAVIKPGLAVLEAQGGSVTDRVVGFMQTHGEMGVTRREDLLLLISMSIEFAGRTGEASQRIRTCYAALYGALERLIAAGQARGEIRRDLPALELVSALIALHDGAFLEWHRRGGQLDGRALVRAVNALVSAGVDASNEAASARRRTRSTRTWSGTPAHTLRRGDDDEGE